MTKILPLLSIMIAGSSNLLANTYGAPPGPDFRTLTGDPVFLVGDQLHGTLTETDTDLIQLRTPPPSVPQFPAFIRYTFNVDYENESPTNSEIRLTVLDTSTPYGNLGSGGIFHKDGGVRSARPLSFVNFALASGAELRWNLSIQPAQAPARPTNYVVTYNAEPVPVQDRGELPSSYSDEQNMELGTTKIDKFKVSGPTEVDAVLTPSGSIFMMYGMLAIFDGNGDVIKAAIDQDGHDTYFSPRIHATLQPGTYYVLSARDYVRVGYDISDPKASPTWDRKGFSQTLSNDSYPMGVTLSIRSAAAKGKK